MVLPFPPQPDPMAPPPGGDMPLPAFAPPIPMGPSPEDIMAMVAEAVEAIEAEVEKDTKPRYPKWLKMTGKGKSEHPVDYPRPDPAEALQFAKDQFGKYSAVRSRFQDDIRFIIGQYGGTTFDDAKDDEKLNPYRESMVQAETEFLVATIGAIDPIYDPAIRRRSEADEAANKADFLYACDDEAERRYLISGNGPIRTDIVRTELLYGRIVAQTMYTTDCEEGEIPLREALIDPMTCAPVFEGDRGMSHMIRQFRTTLSQASSSFNYDGEFRKKLESERGWNKKYTGETSCEVIEYWDRWWRLVWVDSILIVGPVAHRLVEPPFIYQLGALGLPGHIAALTTTDGSTYATHATTPDSALPNKGLSFAHLLRQPIALRESIYSRILTQFRRAIDPAYLVAQDHIADAKGVPEIDNSPNNVNTTLRGHEDITTLPAGPGANNEFVTLMQGNNDQLGRLMAPASAYGIGEGGNGSGYAMENLNENGRDKFTPHILTVQMFYTQLAEKRLKMLADHGWMLQQGDMPFGKFEVARPKPLPFQEPSFILTPGDIRRTGTRVRVKMTRTKLQSMSQLTNALAIMKNMGLGNPVWFWEMIGHPNPERAVQEDRYWSMMDDPALKRAEMIDYLKKNQRPDLVAYIEAQSETPAAPGMMPTDQLSAGAEMGSPVSIQGASLPGLGMPPGPVQ